MQLGGSFADIAFGPGTNIAVQEIEGLDMPELRTSNQARALDHGMRVGRNLFGERIITISFGLYAPDEAVFDFVATVFAGMYSKQDQEYPLVFDGGRRVIYCRAHRGTLARDFTSTQPQRMGFGTIQFVATDPRIYLNELNSDSVGLPTVSVGTPWPMSWPLSWDGSTSTTISSLGGVIRVNNGGTFETPWVGQFDTSGTFVSGPRVENVTTGQALDFASLVLQPGQYLKLDAHERTADLNGEASRYGTLTSESRWFYLKPGVNEIRASARSATTGSAFTITWRSAYL